MNKKLFNSITAVLAIVLGLFACMANAAENLPDRYTAKGSVYFATDASEKATKESGAFASIAWIEANKVVSTDDNGQFVFKGLSGNNITLIASFVGYTRDTIVLVKDGNLLADAANLVFTLYDENTLKELVITGHQDANYLSKMTPVKTEVITAAGLCKMACCSLAESFENSASVSVGYSDAITGAKQIKLLGLSGAYTQMLDENRPVMRGLAAPFGLTYVPGQWLESIQIAKGPSSVINGLEAVTGQINMEHRKPTAENPLFVNLFLNNNLRTEANIASSLCLDEAKHWYTVIMAHAAIDAQNHDGNHDTFRDEPYTHRYALDNRWLYAPSNGVQLRFGIKGLSEDRIGGMMDYKKGMNDRTNTDRESSIMWGEGYSKGLWGSEIKNRSLDGFVKLGIPLNKDNTRNIAMVGDFNWYKMNSSYGLKNFDGIQRMSFVNLMFMDHTSDVHQYTIGVSGRYDNFTSALEDRYLYAPHTATPSEYKVENNVTNFGRSEKLLGAYGEYTYTQGDKLTVVAGVRADYNWEQGWQVAPRASVKYSFTPNTIVRVNAGRGFRTPDVIADNLGVLSTGRKIVFENNTSGKEWKIESEDAWTFGGNFTQHFKIGGNENNYISFDYFRTNFNKRLIVDWDKYWTSWHSNRLDPNAGQQAVSMYYSKEKSYTDTYQIDLSLEPIDRFTIVTTYRYTNAKITMDKQGLIDAPMTSKYKGVINLQYATNLRKWVFDFTAQVNGPMYMPTQYVEVEGKTKSPAYPMLYCQITKKFKGVDVYAGVENITNYKQKNPIIGYDKPFSPNFNASMVWGPLMGTMYYIGLRYTMWK